MTDAARARVAPGVPWTSADVGGGLVAVHAHPDDETLSTGALIASFAAAGLPVTVVTCTRGERGEVLALPGTSSEGLAAIEGDGPALAAHRTGELRAALAALGGGDPAAVGHTFLDRLPLPSPFPAAAAQAGEHSRAHLAAERGHAAQDARFEDSGMVWLAPGVAGGDPAVVDGFAFVPLDDAAARLALLLRRLRPSVVATYEAGGGYGHPDHVRAHQVAVRAIALAGDPAFDAAGSPARTRAWAPALWQRVESAAGLRARRAALAAAPAARALAARAGLTFPSATDPLPALARDDDVLASAHVASVAVRPVLGRVVAAMTAHATQIQHVTTPGAASPGVLGWYALSHGVLDAIGQDESYVVTQPGCRPTSVGSRG
ncbi:PIG-L family deacetylase [Xylanimonas allomyrinae]|nr:PIG-L family deacetylase [Xylanimonas allomyrinae]